MVQQPIGVIFGGPGGPRWCNFGPRGWIGRAARDALRLPMSNLLASIVVGASAVTTSAIFFVASPHDGSLARGLTVLSGFIVGVVVGIFLVWLWGISPMGRHSHWRVRDEADDIYLESRCYHTVRNMRCEIIIPNGNREEVEWLPGGKTQFPCSPGTATQRVNFNDQFGDPPPPGLYRFKWSMDTEGGTKLLVLGRAKRRLPRPDSLWSSLLSKIRRGTH